MNGDRGRKVRRLLKALDKGDRHDRAEAAVELGQLGVQKARPALEAMLDDSDDLVAVAAIYATWVLGGEEVPIERAAASLASADEEVVQAAVQALCEIGDGAVPGLLALLGSSSPYSRQILHILGDIGGEQARAVLERFSRSGDQDLAEAAGEALEDWEDDLY